MIFRGHVKHGVVIVDRRPALRDGAEVRVELVDEEPEKPLRDEHGPTLADVSHRQPADLPEARVPVLPPAAPRRKTLAEQLGDLIGSVPDLPSDMAEQHDQYLHGAPKR